MHIKYITFGSYFFGSNQRSNFSFAIQFDPCIRNEWKNTSESSTAENGIAFLCIYLLTYKMDAIIKLNKFI